LADAPRGEEPDSRQLAADLRLELTPRDDALLSSAGVRTLGDLRRVVARDESWVEQESTTLRTLLALARLSPLPTTLSEDARLVTAGLDGLEAIAGASPELLAKTLSPDRAPLIRRAADAQVRFLLELSAEERIRAVADSSQPNEACGCEDCRSALGPLAYLADLLDYAIGHLQFQGRPITLAWLAARFYQPFGDLVASCEALEERVLQPRICVEVLRRYLAAHPLGPQRPNDLAALNSWEWKHLRDAYFLFLERHGTSFDELRRAHTASLPQREALARRLGIERAQDLDMFLIDPEIEPPAPDALSEERLDQLFGLLQPQHMSDLLAARLQHLRWTWGREDWPPNAPPDTPPTIDPNVIGTADLTDPTPGHIPFELWQRRRQQVDLWVAAARETHRLAGLDSLLASLLNGTGTAELITLRDRRQAGEDVAPELTQLGLTEAAFEHLVMVVELDSSGSVLDAEYAGVYDILVQVQKRREFPHWRDEERQPPPPLAGPPVVLGPDDFRLRAPPPEGSVELSLNPWLASRQERRRWERVLRARTASDAALRADAERVAWEVEEATIVPLRDALVAAAGAVGVPLTERAERLTRHLQIDARSAVCRKTSHAAQAIETLQGIMLGARNGLLEDAEATLAAAAFEAEWAWIGSYETWRPAMLVFLHPETALRPTLRRTASPAFTSLVDSLRASPRLHPGIALTAAAGYAAYFADVCALVPAGMHRSSQAQRPGSGSAGLPGVTTRRVFAVGRSSNSGKLYASTWEEGPVSAAGGAPTFWAEVSGLPAGIELTGLVPYQASQGRPAVGLYAVQRTPDEQRVYFTAEAGAGWSPPVRSDRIPALIRSFEAVGSVAPEPSAGSSGWPIGSDDRLVALDVDNDGREELIAFGPTAGGRQRVALLRERDGALAVAWQGSIEGNWEPAGARPVVLTVSLSGYPWQAERLLVVDRTGLRIGLLGWRWDTQRLELTWSGGTVPGPGGTAGWKVALASTVGASTMPNAFAAADIDGSGRRKVLVFDYVPGEHWRAPVGTRVQILDVLDDRLQFRASVGVPFPLSIRPTHTGPDGYAVRWERPLAVMSWAQAGPAREDVVVLADRPRHTVFDGGSSGGAYEERVWIGILRWDTAQGRFATTLYETPKYEPPKPGQWQAATDDELFPVGQGILAWNSGKRHIGLLRADGRGLALAWAREERVPSGATQAEPWTLSAGDRLVIGDLDADFVDEVVLAGRETLGIMDPATGSMRWTVVSRVAAPGAGGLEGWRLTADTRLVLADLDSDGLDELVVVGPGAGRVGILRSIPAPTVDSGVDRFGPLGVRASSVVPKGPGGGEELQARRKDILDAYAANEKLPNNLPYLDEAYYFVPVELALRLAVSGYWTEALDWLSSVYDYAAPPDQRKIAGKLILEERLNRRYERDDDWLLDPLNAHAIAQSRPGAHTRFTMLAIVECLLGFADSEFARATTDSVPRARALYQAALALLDTPPLGPPADACQKLIEGLDIQIGGDEWVWVPLEVKRALGQIVAPEILAAVVRAIRELGSDGNEPAGRLAAIRSIIHNAQSHDAQAPTLARLLDEHTRTGRETHAKLLADDSVTAALTRVGAQATAVGTWATITGVFQFQPAPKLPFCILPNPAVQAARSRAEVNLHKIRTCRNIAGLPVEAAEPDGPQRRFQPLPYRYATLVERARQLVQLAAGVETSMLAAIEKADIKAYEILKARQDLGLAQAGIRLRELTMSEATDAVRLGELQRDRAEIQVDHYTGLVRGGLLQAEQQAIDALGTAATFAMGDVFDTFVGLLAGRGGGLPGSISRAYGAEAQAKLTFASFQRRAAEWQLAKALAEQDARQGWQQIRLADDRLRVTEQDLEIANLQADHASAILEFLNTKQFGNAQLYEWMSGVLEPIYRFFLQEATSIARLAEAQLAFERQEVPPAFIKANYWLPPELREADSGEPGPGDRRGLTGSVRLLRDLTALDQYAFQTNQRKLQLTKTISLAQLDPYALQRLRETGVVVVATPQRLFDDDFRGHYLRLIRRVRTTLIALIPPFQGIRATLATTGTSRVVVPDGDSFPTVTMRRAPESVALSTPAGATGVFDLDPEPELRLPFEGLGVDTLWQFELPKAANPFDFSTLADLLLTIDYTALSSAVYRARMTDDLDRQVEQERPFIFSQNLADQWFDLHNPEQAPGPPMEVSFTTHPGDFAPNVSGQAITKLAIYYAPAPGVSLPAAALKTELLLTASSGTRHGVADPVNGLISTAAGATGWRSFITGTVSPLGTWTLRLPDTPNTRDLFTKELVREIIMVISYQAVAPPWPE
jgi:hypothetical protein